MDALLYNRLQFAATVTFHYLFPQLTMGLALLIFYLRTQAMRRQDEHFALAARFWTKIFAVTFAFGVVTGIPMEFQFGTNWANFSRFAGGVIGQTLAMEGMFSFFLESFLLGVMLFGEKRLGPKVVWVATLLVFFGSWLSGYFIIATNAWMQHPVGYTIAADGSVQLNDFWALVLNPWALWQYAHNMLGSVTTAAFLMAGLGAYYLLAKKHEAYGKLFLRTGLAAAFVAAALLIFPTGDQQGRDIFEFQPAKGAAMEGHFYTEADAPLVIVGQPNMKTLTLDNPILIPDALSFLTYHRFSAVVTGLTDFPQDEWPDQVPLLYYSYHIMVGLGTIFVTVTAVSLYYLWRKNLFKTSWLLWLIMLSAPFPYIANTAGWMTAELGRQPWLVYGLQHTSDGVSPLISGGNAVFTLLGFLGLYLGVGILYILLVLKEINHGPEPISG
ncbi:MAG: cytochrome ubiquinol oxidase subunit I [Anaerolineales bacterium]|nr:cytochrome ubiquinol oxidase subunit I [Anaerolineales bacterium]